MSFVGFSVLKISLTDCNREFPSLRREKKVILPSGYEQSQNLRKICMFTGIVLDNNIVIVLKV